MLLYKEFIFLIDYSAERQNFWF